MTDLRHYFEGQKDAMVELLTDLISYETFTQEKAKVDALGQFMEKRFRALGASSVTRYPQTQVGDFLLAKWNEDVEGKPILFLIHIDTVWPSGTLAKRPVTIDADGKLYGPGAVDMKGGITIVLTALRGLQELAMTPKHPIWVLMTSDEEVGSLYSEPLIKEIGKEAGLVLVMEPATKEGALKTQRKGVATYDVFIEGRASHAGNAPEQGINAIIELAQQALKLNEMNDLKNGISVSVTMASGGSAGNVIPAEAKFYVDTRMITMRDMDALHQAITQLQPFIPGAKVLVSPRHQRPPMERNEQMIRAFTQVQRIASGIGLIEREDSSGGGSDGNFTAAMGIPTLDGLGPQGDGLHADYEHVVINSLPRRAALIAAMLCEWEFDA